MNKHLAFILFIFFVATVHAGAQDGNVEINGFISQGFLKSDTHDIYFADTEDGTFQFNEAGLTFTTHVSDRLRLGMQIFAKDLGSMGNDEITVDYAYGDYRFENWFGLRAGKMKKPSGLYNQSRDVDITRTFIILPPSVYNENYRDAQLAAKGVSVYGTLPVHIHYQVMYGVFDTPTDGPIVSKIDNFLGGEPTDSAKNEEFYLGALRWNTPITGLLFGGEYNYYKIALDNPMFNEFEIIGTYWIASVEYHRRKLIFAVEYKLLTNKVEINGFSISDVDSENFYISLTHRFTEWFETGAYYSVEYSDKDDKDGDSFKADGEPAAQAWLKDTAICARFDLNSNWVFKLEGHFMDGLLDVTYPESDPDPSDKWFLFAAKLSFAF